MSIEFTCNQCGAELTAPDAAAGKRAKCPSCAAATLAPIPEGMARPEPPVPAGPFGYLPPVVPSRIELGDVVGRTWDVYYRNLWTLIAVVFLAGAGSAVAAIVGLAYDAAVVWLLLQLGWFEAAVLAGILLLIPLLMPAVWIHVGQVVYVRRMARGQRAELADLLRGGPMTVHYFKAALLLMLLTVLGTAACIVPGVWLAVVLAPWLFLIVDRQARPREAFTASRQLTAGNRTALLLVLAVHAGVLMLAQAIPLGIGHLFATPFLALLWAVAYLRLTGQATAAVVRSGE